MRALISLTIIAAVLISANSTWKRIERDFAPQARVSVEHINSSITNTTNNPFTTTATKQVAAATIKSNPTPVEIIVPRNCSGMDCYPDLEEILTVMAAN